MDAKPWIGKFLYGIVLSLCLIASQGSADVRCRIKILPKNSADRLAARFFFSEPVRGFSKKDIIVQNGDIDAFRSLRNEKKKSRALKRYKATVSPRWKDKTSDSLMLIFDIEARSVKSLRSRRMNSACGATFLQRRTTVPVSDDDPRTPDSIDPRETAVPDTTATSVAQGTPFPPPQVTPTIVAIVPPAATPTRTPTPRGSGIQCSGIQEISSPLQTFPGAAGFGARAVGGSGRHLRSPCTTVYRVTTLKDSGKGSLRECAEASGPRTCVFEVGGVIWTTRDLKISNPFITIAGQTAPEPGIILRGASLSINASEVIIQHLRLRVGDDPRMECCKAGLCSAIEAQVCTSDPGGRDGIKIVASPNAIDNILIDHVSIAWALDEGFSIVPEKGDISNVTFSNSIISSGLDMSIHPEAGSASDPGHSKAVLINGAGSVRGLSFIGNLLAHNADRNIRASTPLQMEYINNVIYNWGRGRGAGRTIELSNTVNAIHALDLIGNVYSPGLDTFCPSTQYRPELCFENQKDGIDSSEEQSHMHYILRNGSGSDSGWNRESRYYLKDNLGPTRQRIDMSEWSIADRLFFKGGLFEMSFFPEIQAQKRTAFSNDFQILSSSETMNTVVSRAGALSAERDTVDSAVETDVATGAGRIINCVEDDGSERCRKNAGGWPDYSPSQRVLMLPVDSTGDDDRNGYTNLEETLFQYGQGRTRP